MSALMANAGGLLLRASLLRTAALFATVATAFFLMPFIIDAIGQRYYGMWALVGIIVGYYGHLDFGLSQAVQYFIARALGKADTAEISRMVATGLAVFGLLGLVAFAVSLLIAACAPLFFDDPIDVARFRTVMLIMGANVLIAFPMLALNGLFSANLRYDLISGIELAKLAARTALIVYFLGHGYSIVALAVIQTAVDFAAHAAKLFLARRLFKDFSILRGRPELTLLRPLFAYGGKAFTHSLADVLRFQADALVVASFMSLTAVAVYNVAAQLVEYFRQLLAVTFGVIVPVFARFAGTDDNENMKRIFVFSSKVAAALAVLVGGNAIVFGKLFIATWLGASFAEAYGVLVILILAAMVHVAQTPGISLIYGVAQHGPYAKVAIAEGLVNLALSLILIGPYGLEGVALGTMLPMLLSAGYIAWYVTRYLGYSLTAHLRSVGPIVVLGVICHILAWQIVQRAHPQQLIAIFAYAGVLLPLEGLLLFLVGFTAPEREVVYRSVRTVARASGHATP